MFRVQYVCMIHTVCPPAPTLPPPPVWPFSCGAGGSNDSVFDVEKAVGTIIIAKPLDAEQRSFYNLTVQVTDGTNIAYTQVLHKV